MLVAERFIASLMEPYQYEMTTVKLEVAQHQFKMKENIPLQLGYKALFDTTQTEVKETTFPSRATISNFTNKYKETSNNTTRLF